MSGSDMGDAAGAGPGSAGPKAPNVRIRTFAGEANKYEEWKREVEANKVIYNLDAKQLAGLALGGVSP